MHLGCLCILGLPVAGGVTYTRKGHNEISPHSPKSNSGGKAVAVGLGQGLGWENFLISYLLLRDFIIILFMLCTFLRGRYYVPIWEQIDTVHLQCHSVPQVLQQWEREDYCIISSNTSFFFFFVYFFIGVKFANIQHNSQCSSHQGQPQCPSPSHPNTSF